MDEELYYDDSNRTESDDSFKIKTIEGIKTNSGVTSISDTPSVTLGNTYTNNTPTQSTTQNYVSKASTEAKTQAELDIAAGVEHVQDDKDTEEYIDTTALYEKTLGVTQYDELRTKLHLEEDESFTDYYERTGYIPKGFEVQAKMLLAEEKRKKLYAEMQAGNMSEEDFLYEAYGKDLLKQDGIDFESRLYWYQRYKNKKYDDPRDNSTFMLQLIEQARELFQEEKWHEEKATKTLSDALAGIATGEVLSADTLEDIFPEQFEAFTEALGDRAKVIKYYRSGLLQGFDPTIDADGDGKIDYYYSTDGKLYNVSESGGGANTYKIYYKKDSNGNLIMNEQTGKYEFTRIVSSDSVAGEVVGEFFKGIARFFTDVVDLVALAGAAVVDLGQGIFTGDWDTSAITETSATMGQLWNSTIIGDHDLIQGSGWSDGAQVGRQIARFGGTIAAFAATAFIGAAVNAATTAGKAAGKAATSGVKAGAKAAVNATVKKTAAQKVGEWMAKVGSTKVMQTVPGKAVKAISKFVTTTAVSLTSWSNGAFGAGIGARIGTSAMLATRDFLTSTATLAINQKALGLSDSEVVSKAFTGAAINFGASMLLRQIADDGAMKAWSKVFHSSKKATQQAAAGAVFKNTAPTFWGKILDGTLSGKAKIGVGIANTVMDQIENIITAGTQTSLVQTGDVWNWEAIGNMMKSPQFIASSIYQTKMALNDELKYDSKKLMGAIADTSRMDQEFRAYIAQSKSKLNLDNPDDTVKLQALNDLLTDYDLTIKTKTAETNTTTGENYTRAEATLFAIEKVVKGIDMDADSDFIKLQKEHLNKVIKDKKVLYAQAVFNSLEENYKSYNKLVEAGFKGNIPNNIKAHWWYGKNSAELYKHFADYTSRYMAVPLDLQIIYDTYGEDGYYDRLFRATGELTALDKLDSIAVSSLVTGVTEKDGLYTVHSKLDGGSTDFSQEESINFKKKVVDVYGLNQDTGSIVVVSVKKRDGQSIDQAELTQVQNCLTATAQTFEKLNGLDPDNNPLLIKLSEDTYVIPNFNLGNTLEVSQHIGSLLKCMINLKFDKSLTPEQQLKTVSLILQHTYQHSKDVTDIDILNEHIKDIPDLINSLVGDSNKVRVLSKVDAARLLSFIKNNLKEGVSLPLPDEEGKNTNNTYNRVYDILKVSEDYTKVQEALEVIRKGALEDSKDTEPKKTKEYVKAMSEIQKFKETYIKLKDNELIETDLLKDCFDGHLFTKEAISAIGNIPFLLDLKDQQYLSHYLESLSTFSLKRGEVTEEEYRAFLKYMIKKLGVETDAGLKDTTSLKHFVSEILAGRKATKQKSGVTKKQRDAIKTALDPIIKNKDLITNVSISEFKKAIQSSDIEASIKKDLLSDIESSAILNKALLTIVKAYNTENIFADAANIKKIQGYEEDPLNTAINYLDEKYGGTIQQYKTVEDMFEESINKYKEVTKLCDENYIQGKNVLVLDLTTMLGTEGEKVARKMSGDKAISDYMKAEDHEKEGIVFADNATKAAFQEEQMKLHSLYASRANNKSGDYVLVFDLDNSKEVARAKKLLKDIYNFNGDIMYMAGKGEHPGIYMMSDAFIGFTLSNKKEALHDLYVEAIKHQHNIEKKVDIYNYSDPLALLESFTSGYTFIEDTTELRDASKIIFNTLQEIDPDNIDYNDITYVNSLSSWVNYINVKLGKLAGNKVKEIAIRYSGIHLSTPDNALLKQKLFLYKSIEALSKLYDKDTYVAVNVVPVKLSKKEVDYAKQLWSVDAIEGSKDLYYLNIDPKKSSEDFKNAAYKLLASYKDTETNLFKVLVPLAQGESLHNGIIRKAEDGTALSYQDTNGYTPYSIINKELRGMFTEQEIDNYLLNLTIKDIGSVDFTADTIKKAEAELKTCKTPEDILNLDSTNFFVQMQKNAVAASLVVSKTIKESIQTLFPETYEGIYNILGDADSRKNLAIAIRQHLPEAEFDEDGYLIITDELVSAIIKDIKNIHADADSKNATNMVYDSGSNVLTGSQTSLLKASTASTKITETELKDLLTVLNMSRQELLSQEAYEENPLMQFYAMCKAASDKDKVQISLQSLYGLTKADIKKLEEPLTRILGKESYKKLKQTIDKIHTGDTEDIDTTPDRAGPGEIKAVGRNTSDGVIQEVGENLKKSHPDFYQKAIARLKKRRNSDNFVKLADKQDIETNLIMSRMYADITNTKALVTKNLGSSTILNMNRTENVAALYYTINALASKLETLDMGESKLTRQDSLDLAWSLMLYSTGTQFETNFPEYIFYDKKNKKIINDHRSGIAVSGDKYSNPYDNLVATIYHDYMKEDGTLDLDNIIILSADRNSFATLYTESPSNFRYLDMDIERHKIEELLHDSIKDFIESRGLRSSAENKITDEERISEYSKYLFSALHRTRGEYNRQSAKLAEDISIKGSIQSINTDPSDLSFMNSRNNTIEELMSGLKARILQTTDLTNRNKQQSKYQKTKDFVSFGITDDVFNSYSDLKTRIEEHSSTKRKEAKTNLINLKHLTDKKEIAELRVEVDRILRHITDAFDEGDKETFNIGIENLCSKLSSNKHKVTREEVAKDVITYFIASSPYLENKMFMSLDGDYKEAKGKISENNSPTFTSVKTVEGRTVASKTYNKNELLYAAKLVLDIEATFGNRQSNPFELAISFKSQHAKPESSVLYFPIPGIDPTKPFDDVIKQLRTNEYTAEYMTKYFDKEEGAKVSVQNWYNFFNESEGYRNNASLKFNSLLQKAADEGAILIGFNSENFDIPLLVNKLLQVKGGDYLNWGYGLDNQSAKILLDNRLDMLSLAKSTAIKKNIDIGSGGLTLSSILKLFDIDTKGAHGAESDVNHTLKLVTDFVRDTIDTNRYQYNILDTIETLYKNITGLDKIPDDFNITNLRIDTNKISIETKRLLLKLGDFRLDPNRLSKIQDYLNYSNLRDRMDYSDIRVKERKEILYSNRSSSDIKFAKRFNTLEARENLLDTLSCAVTKEIKQEIEKGLKPNTDSILQKIANKVLPRDSIFSLQDNE